MRIFLAFLATMTILAPCVRAGHEVSDRLQQSLSFESVKGRVLEIDNIEGDVIVEGYAGDVVLLDVQKTIYAQSDAALAAAKNEVSLEITNANNSILLYVDGPFRDEMHRNGKHRRHPRYHVKYDFKLKVPHELALRLSTVMEGVVQVSETSGDFEISNVNGPIQMRAISGSGSAVTVNGEVRATFTSVPGSDATFRTVNGDLDISYPDHLNADLSLKTFNGDMFTDFETEPLAPEPARKTVSDGLTRLEFNKHTRVRIGVGGPRIICDTLNGSILIRKS